MNTHTKTPPTNNYTNTRWWVNLGAFLISGLVLTGVLSLDNQDQVSDVANHVIDSVSLVISLTSGISLWKYRDEKKKEKAKAKPKPKLDDSDNKLPTRPKTPTKPKRKPTNGRRRSN